MRIDAHQHFWKLASPFTDWPTPDLPAIFKDYGPADLQQKLEEKGIDGTILVQAAPSLAETQFLLDLARTSPFIRGVVGWIDFAAQGALAQLELVGANPLLVGVRPMLQGITETNWILRDNFAPVFEALIARGLAFDGLVSAPQISELTALARRYPDLRIVLDHGGKPNIAGGRFAQWAADISGLAACPNVYCKLSGLWTEAGEDRSSPTIAKYARHLLDSFGADRLMWGSDWPVIELAGTYGDWWDQCFDLLADQTAEAQAAIFGGNAAQFYGVAK